MQVCFIESTRFLVNAAFGSLSSIFDSSNEENS
uniref:Uncharacterized protein n=1 Tax=Arundo donax TaxID=35708 RepID=A0A0A9F677_ARUDO